MHSPVEERKSSANGLFALPSQPSSRNNSLPPSRHSDIAPQYPVMYQDSHSTNTFRNNSMSGIARANGGAATRFDSPMNNVATQFAQINMNGENQGPSSQRPSLSGVSSFLGQTSAYNTSPQAIRLQTFNPANVQYDTEDTEEVPRNQYQDAFLTQPMSDSINFREPQYGARSSFSANNSAQYPRQPAHYPGSAASQRSYDHLNASQMTNGFSNPLGPHNHAAALDQKLRSLPMQFQEQQFTAQDQRQISLARPAQPNFYGQYGFPQGMPVYNMQIHPSFSGFPMGMMPIGMDMALVPRAPREHFESGQNVRSQLLDDFKQNIKTSKRYELKVRTSNPQPDHSSLHTQDIYDHVVEFSGDQHGSRFIQLKLESANSDEKERIFRELQGNALQLMTDVFGNYVIQKFFEHGDQTQKKTLANKMKGQVRQLSLQMYGCRVVQKVSQ